MNALFDLLVNASDNNWCWNLFCTTCGHQDLRKGFDKIIGGNGFADFSATHDQKQELRILAANIDLRDASKQMKFPDWLGYFGIILFRTEPVERDTMLLTDHFTQQLQPFGVDWKKYLDDQGRSHMNYTDLEYLESLILNGQLKLS